MDIMITPLCYLIRIFGDLFRGLIMRAYWYFVCFCIKLFTLLNFNPCCFDIFLFFLLLFFFSNFLSSISRNADKKNEGRRNNQKAMKNYLYEYVTEVGSISMLKNITPPYRNIYIYKVYVHVCVYVRLFIDLVSGLYITNSEKEFA